MFWDIPSGQRLPVNHSFIRKNILDESATVKVQFWREKSNIWKIFFHLFKILLIEKKKNIKKQKWEMPWPGFEPGLLRPQRRVLTTIRSRLLCKLTDSSSCKSIVDSNETQLANLFFFLLKQEFFSLVSDAIVKAKWLLQLKEDHAKHHFLVTQVRFFFFATAFKVQYTSQQRQLQTSVAL